MTFAPTTAEKTSTALTERSMPAVMMTKVIPTASSMSCDESSAMLRKLVRSKNLVPCQIVKMTIRPTSTTKM
jgi:hypothetical protein